jgi:hypothetical protein
VFFSAGEAAVEVCAQRPLSAPGRSATSGGGSLPRPDKARASRASQRVDFTHLKLHAVTAGSIDPQGPGDSYCGHRSAWNRPISHRLLAIARASSRAGARGSPVANTR